VHNIFADDVAGAESHGGIAISGGVDRQRVRGFVEGRGLASFMHSG